MNAEGENEVEGWLCNVRIRTEGEGIGHDLFLYCSKSELEELMMNTNRLSRSRAGIRIQFFVNVRHWLLCHTGGLIMGTLMNMFCNVFRDLWTDRMVLS
jgi:hypothetical protein